MNASLFFTLAFCLASSVLAAPGKSAPQTPPAGMKIPSTPALLDTPFTNSTNMGKNLEQPGLHRPGCTVDDPVPDKTRAHCSRWTQLPKYPSPKRAVSITYELVIPMCLAPVTTSVCGDKYFKEMFRGVAMLPPFWFWDCAYMTDKYEHVYPEYSTMIIMRWINGGFGDIPSLQDVTDRVKKISKEYFGGDGFEVKCNDFGINKPVAPDTVWP